MEKSAFNNAVKAAGGKIDFISNRAYKHLQTMIPDAEKIIAAGEWIENKIVGALIITNKNFHASIPTGVFASDTDTIPLQTIISFSISGRLWLKDLYISLGHKIYTYPSISNHKNIMTALNTGKNASTSESTPVIINNQMVGVTAPLPDTASELRKLKALVDEGIITQRDFINKKVALLGIQVDPNEYEQVNNDIEPIKIAPRTNICPNCNTSLKQNARFCTMCGQKIN
jgi:hypothetical protein